MPTVQAILLDPEKRTAEEITIPNTGYQEWKKVLGITSPIQFVRLEHLGEEKYTYILVDEEGLYKDDNHYFKLDIYTQPLSGRALIVSIDEGDDSGDLINTEWTKDMGGLRWMPRDFKVEPQGFEYVDLTDPEKLN
jgi:hypothetical protein|tara:strand:+ start:657 stop:1064 length:408 start_codon:yes stop_codon:yes gene_type:complete